MIPIHSHHTVSVARFTGGRRERERWFEERGGVDGGLGESAGTVCDAGRV